MSGLPKHEWSYHADHPCWCGGWHRLLEAWRLNVMVDVEESEEPVVTMTERAVVLDPEEQERIIGWLRWVAHVKDDDCRYDHHGYCQAHNLDEYPCPVGQIKEYLAEKGLLDDDTE